MNIEEEMKESLVRYPWIVRKEKMIPVGTKKTFLPCIGGEHPLTIPPPKLPIIGGEHPLFLKNHW
jgi:hypothetical protein